MTPTPFQPTPICTISYQGEVDAEVEEIRSELENSGLEIAEPQLVSDSKKHLGAGHIVISFVLSAAGKAVLQMAFTRLLNYLVNRLEHQKTAPKSGEAASATPAAKTIQLRIVLRNESHEVVGGELLALKDANVDAVRTSVDRLSVTVSEHVGT